MCSPYRSFHHFCPAYQLFSLKGLPDKPYCASMFQILYVPKKKKKKKNYAMLPLIFFAFFRIVCTKYSVYIFFFVSFENVKRSYRLRRHSLEWECGEDTTRLCLEEKFTFLQLVWLHCCIFIDQRLTREIRYSEWSGGCFYLNKILLKNYTTN